MTIKVLKKGDKVISVTSEFAAIQRKNGTVDLLPIIIDNDGLRINTQAILTIGYGDNVVETTKDGVTITTF